jgi:5'-nucleotidase
MVKQTPVVFRDRLDTMLRFCEEENIPVLIFSAGLADVILQIMILNDLWLPNMHLISNKMIFNEDGICIGFKEPLIHVFNKNEASVVHTTHFSSIQDRRNVILLGDSLGDLRMADGLSHDVSLTIGFLNHDTEEWIEKYEEAFDIVILNDSPMDIVCDLLQAIKGRD